MFKYIDKSKSIELRDIYKKCVSSLNTFRKKHLEMAIHYISDQAKQGEKTEGTGGTEYVKFLSVVNKETRSVK